VLWDIETDPTLAGTKLIAEAWDAAGLYQVGSFGGDSWKEWNGRFRDDVRSFFRGEDGSIEGFADRLIGSPALYGHKQREPEQSVNFVTCHDGFTLHDLVSYEQKHNEANGENNEDGTNDNLSRNWGAEGLEARDRAMRNFIATLAFSQGVPMLSHGDEIARTQRGNNNAYCQDNEITWVNWTVDERQRALLEFARRVFAIRAENPVLRRRTFFTGQVVEHPGLKDLTWLRADGAELSEKDWQDANARSLGMLINGDATDEMDDTGQPIKGDTMFLLVNASDADVEFALPNHGGWRTLVDTARGTETAQPPAHYPLTANSLVLLRRTP
jgi:glycogen operon protein